MFTKLHNSVFIIWLLRVFLIERLWIFNMKCPNRIHNNTQFILIILNKPLLYFKFVKVNHWLQINYDFVALHLNF